jgi:DNA-binding NarL/FixJ family response regulator
MMRRENKKAAKLFIVEEQEIFRQAYKSYFPLETSMELVGMSEYNDVKDIVAALHALNPDVLLMGTKMLCENEVKNLETIREKCPNLSLVLLSSLYDTKGIKHLREFIRGGSKGCAYLLKYSIDTMSQLTQVIYSVLDGRVILDPIVMEHLMDSGDAKSSALRDLSARELEVLNLMAKGCKNETIAEILCVEHKTVERHINSIYSKLGTNTEAKHQRVHAVMLYMQATGQLPGTTFIKESH